MVGTGRDFWQNKAQETAANGCDLLGGCWEKIEKREPREFKKKKNNPNEHKIHKRGDKS